MLSSAVQLVEIIPAAKPKHRHVPGRPETVRLPSRNLCSRFIPESLFGIIPGMPFGIIAESRSPCP